MFFRLRLIVVCCVALVAFCLATEAGVGICERSLSCRVLVVLFYLMALSIEEIGKIVLNPHGSGLDLFVVKSLPHGLTLLLCRYFGN